MKVTVYNCREFDEKELFLRYEKELAMELVLCPDAPDKENAALAKGSLCIDIITSKMTRELLEIFASYGVKYVVTRTIGYDHVDIEAARELGMTVANAPYGPNGVADYAVMLILMTVRRMKSIINRTRIQDYTLKGLMGREIKDLTVGVVGTGRIGKAVLANLSGFGCRRIAYDVYESEDVKKDGVSYVTLDEMWEQADVITLHAPLTEDNYHMLNEETISRMKNGVVIINTARGGLIDSEALIKGIESGKIGGAGLDVVENEFGLYYYDHKEDILDNRELFLLRSFPNVIVSHHMAFYTDDCVETVVRDSLLGCKCFMEGKENPWEVK